VWTLVLADGSERQVTADGVVVGRNPAAPAAWPRAERVAIDDPQRSVSKTHAVLAVADDGSLRVVDLRSTNGVAVTVDGQQRRVSGSGATIQGSAVVTLGQYPLTARHVDSAHG
jgi:predicted component of type VI protein secretion system